MSGIRKLPPFSANSGRLRFDPSRCLPARYPGNECGLCNDVCPVKAIDLVDGIPVLKGECVGCGQCGAACPNDALAADGFIVSPTIADDVAEIFVDCWRVPFDESPEGSLRVPCTAGLSTGRLISLFDRAGERPVHLLDRGECSGCQVGAGISTLRATLTEVRMLLFESGVEINHLPSLTFLPARAPLAPSIPDSAGEVRMGRRSFFRNLADSVARGAEQIAVAGQDVDNPIMLREAAQPIDRLRTVTALGNIARRHDRPLPGRILPQLSLGECSAHGICAKVCPTGALKREVLHDAAELRFLAAHCIACGQCVRSCPDKALRMQPTGGRDITEILAQWPERTCSECDEIFFGTGGETCPACVGNQQLIQGMAVLFRPSA